MTINPVALQNAAWMIAWIIGVGCTVTLAGWLIGSKRLDRLARWVFR